MRVRSTFHLNCGHHWEFIDSYLVLVFYRDADLLFEFIDIRLLQQEERLQALRKSIQGIMSQIQDCLDGLDNLDEMAKVIILRSALC